MSKGPFYRFEVYRLDPDTEAKLGSDPLLVCTALCGEEVQSDSQMVDRRITERVESGEWEKGLFAVELFEVCKYYDISTDTVHRCEPEFPDRLITSRFVWAGDGHRIMWPSEHSEYPHPSEQIHKD